MKTNAIKLATAASAGLLLALTPASTALATTAHTAATKPCSESQVEVWLGDGPGGATAGTTFFPLEFSNVGQRSCSLYGYPGVSAISTTGGQVGKAAIRVSKTPRRIVLAPGATANAAIGIGDWGAICKKGVAVDGLRVYVPGATASEDVDNFPFKVCAKATTMSVQPISAGVGIPGYTNT